MNQSKQLFPFEQVVCLHGFLGLSTDWDLFEESLKKAIDALGCDSATVHFSKPSYFADFEVEAFQGFSNMKNAFSEFLNELAPGPTLYIGYSLGGRLLLSMLESLDQKDCAIFISTHPGLNDEKEKQQRLLNDEVWAEKFLNSPWTEILSEWNKQSIFSDENHSQESHFLSSRAFLESHRKNLSSAVKNLSLGHQPKNNNNCLISSLPKKIWITGSLDQKFSDIAQVFVAKFPEIEWMQIAESGHRIPLTHPHLLAESIATFLFSQEVNHDRKLD